jgi:hypothetical protein
MQKDHVTVMFRDNASGTHEFQLLVIRKSATPFTNYQFKCVISEIFLANSAWVKQNVFKNRLYKILKYAHVIP